MYKKILLLLAILTIFGGGIKEWQATIDDESSIEEYDAPVEITPYAETTPQKAAAEYPVLLNPKDHIEYYVVSEGIFCVYNGKKYGFMREDGLKIPFIYDEAEPFHEGLACVSINGKYGFIDRSGKIALPFIYDKLNSFNEGLAYFERDEQYGFIDTEGNELLLLDYDSVSSFHEGLAYISVNGKYGYIDMQGREIIKPEYNDADFFQNGMTKVRISDKIGVIDTWGRGIVPAIYDNLYIDENFVVVVSDGSYGCYNSYGECLLPPEYSAVSLSNNNFIVTLDGLSGLANLNGEIVLPPAYDKITELPETALFKIEHCGKYGVCDSEGDLKIPVTYDRLFVNGSNHNGLASIRQNDKYGFISLSDGNVVISPAYDATSGFVNNRAAVSLNKKYGMIDDKGAVVIDFKYEDIIIFDNGTAALKQNGSYYLTDYEENRLTENSYDVIKKTGQCYYVKVDGLSGYLNKYGEEIKPFTYSYVSETPNNVFQLPYYYRYDGLINYDAPGTIAVTDKYKAADLSRLFLRNEITPRIKPYHDFCFENDASWCETWDVGEMDVSIKKMRLYHIDGLQDPVLYAKAVPIVDHAYRKSFSGFYLLSDQQVSKILTSYESQYTWSGEYSCFFTDTVNSKLFPGIMTHIEGTYWYRYGKNIYQFEEEAEQSISILHSKNWKQHVNSKDLIYNPELFYDELNLPLTYSTIKDAQFLISYEIDGERVPFDEYEQVSKRYRTVPIFD